MQKLAVATTIIFGRLCSPIPAPPTTPIETCIKNQVTTGSPLPNKFNGLETLPEECAKVFIKSLFALNTTTVPDPKKLRQSLRLQTPNEVLVDPNNNRKVAFSSGHLLADAVGYNNPQQYTNMTATLALITNIGNKNPSFFPPSPLAHYHGSQNPNAANIGVCLVSFVCSPTNNMGTILYNKPRPNNPKESQQCFNINTEKTINTSKSDKGSPTSSGTVTVLNPIYT